MKTRTKLLLPLMLLCIALFALVLTASAATYSGTSNGLKWTLNTNTGVLSVTGTGAMQDYSIYSAFTAPWNSYTSSIKTVKIANGVTNIGTYAFSGCKNLTSITIPDSVASIAENAFAGCSNLTSITIPDSVTRIGSYAFQYCSSLTSITIPDSVTRIGDKAFYGCSSLTSITIPDSVTSIGAGAFSGCSKLTSITIPDGVTSIGYNTFYNCSSLKSITIPDGVTSIGSIAFYNTAWLNNQPDGVVYAGKVAYTYKGNMPSGTQITLKQGTAGIADDAFYGCSNLTSITIPDGVTSIGDEAFSGCSKLTSITIPDGVTSIGDEAFYKCSKLTSITIPDSVSYIGWLAFDNTKWLNNQPNGVVYAGKVAYTYKGNMPSGTQITLKQGTVGIAARAFKDCSNLTSITIPDSVTRIGGEAFYECYWLTSITIPDSVTRIGDGAFYKCSRLTSITIPFIGASRDAENGYDQVLGYIFGRYGSSVIGTTFQYKTYVDYYYFIPTALRSVTVTDAATIPYHAFYNCSNLESITIPDSVTSIGSDAFYNTAWLNNQPDGVVYAGKVAYTYKGNMPSGTQITLKQGTVGIAARAFKDCSNLTSITIPDGVTSIGECAFYGCSDLRFVFFLGTEQQYCDIQIEFYNDALHAAHKVYSYVATEGDWCIDQNGAASYMGSKKSIAVPKTVAGKEVSGIAYVTPQVSVIAIDLHVTEVYASAFADTALKRVNYTGTAPQWNKIKIGDDNAPLKNAEKSYYVSAFGDFLVSRGGVLVGYTGDAAYLTIPAQIEDYEIKQIGSYAFQDSMVQRILLPASVQTIGASAFGGCTGLTHAYYGGEWQSLSIASGNDCLTNAKQYGDAFQSGTYIADKNGQLLSWWGALDAQSASIPETLDGVTVKRIVPSAFHKLSALRQLTIPDCVETVDAKAIAGCTALEEIMLPFVGASRAGNTLFDYIFDSVPACLHKVTITGVTTIPAQAFKNCSSLESVIIGNGVTSIGQYAFSGCSSLESVIIGNGVTSIGQYAFSGCSSLESVTIPGSVKGIGSNAFENCSRLESATIQTGVTSIGQYAFSGCSSLKSITIPGSVESIGDYVFSGCSGLGSAIVKSGVKAIGKYAFFKCSSLESVRIENGVTSIGESAFCGCSNLGSITIPGSVTSIEAYTFSNCSNLESVTALKGVTSIGAYAFSNCGSLKSVSLADSVKEIAEHAFEKSTALTAITIPDSVTDIGAYAFSGCTSLARITIPASVTSIGYDAFYNCSGLVSVVFDVGSKLTTIGESAFENCSSLATVAFAENSKPIAIGADAFKGCTALEKVRLCDIAAWCVTTFGNSNANPVMLAGKLYDADDKPMTTLEIPAGVTTIGTDAFRNAANVEHVLIPASVSAIRQAAFSGCTGLADISFAADSSLASIGTDAFSGCTGLTKVTVEDLGAWSETSFANAAANPLSLAKHLYSGGKLVKRLTLPEGTTRVSAYAFYNCADLTGITVPDSVTKIGEWAFYGCSNLKSMTLPFVGSGRGVRGSYDAVFGYIFGSTTSSADGAVLQNYSASGSRYYYIPSTLTRVIITGETLLPYGAFSNCESLVAVALPDTLTEMQDKAFANCVNMTAIVLPASVKTFSATVFDGISGFENVYYTGSESDWSSISISGSSSVLDSAEVYYGCKVYGDFVIYEGSIAQAYFGPDLYVEIPATVGGVTITEIGEFAFYGNMEVRSISVPDSVTKIGSNAFNGCTELSNVKIGSKLTSIGQNGFRDCKVLTQITLPVTLKTVGSYAFSNCAALADVYYGGSETTWNAMTIYNSISNEPLLNATRHYGMVSDGAVTVVGGTIIGMGPQESTTIAVPGTVGGTTVRELAGYVFENNTDVEMVVIPDGFTKIGDYAFRDAEKLRSVVIPASVTDIGKDIFDGCSKDLIVYGAAGSAAETYAKANGISFVTLTDDTHIYAREWTIDRKETCTVPGEQSHHCIRHTDCGARSDVTGIPAPGHKFGEWKVRVAAKCEETGVDYHVCSVCQFEETRTTDKLGHNYSTSWTVDTPEGCLTTGSKSHHCTRCDAITDVTEIPAAGHKFGEWKVRVAAKCEETGVDYHVCAVCQFEETRTTAKLNHNYATTWTIDKPETCTVPGSKSHHCTRCDAKTDITEIAPKGHNLPSTPTEPEIAPTVSKEGRTAIYRCQNAGCDYFEGGKPIAKKNAGDLNGNGKITKADLLLLQKYLAGWKVEMDVAAADCNGDGKVSKADLLLLQKYLAGWDVKLGK